jgi:hypothetical protein
VNLFISAYPLLVYLLCSALEFNQLVKLESENNIRAKIKKKKQKLGICPMISNNVHSTFHNSTEFYGEYCWKYLDK